MKNLIILGIGDFARELFWHIQDSIGYGTEFVLKGYLEYKYETKEIDKSKLQLPVIGTFEDYEIQEDDVFTCAICTPKIRKAVINQILDKGGEFISIIHKQSIQHGTASLGKGIVLCPFSYVNDHAKVGDYVMINNMSGLGHDVELGDYSCLMGHVELCGYVKVGNAVYFGGGSRVLPHGKIGDEAYIGSGSIVLKKVKAYDRVFGNPAVSIL